MTKSIMLCMLVCAGFLLPAAASAQMTVLDFSGFIYEADNTAGATGFLPSDPGDVLAGSGFIQNISMPLMLSADDYEFTIIFYDLVSMGSWELGAGLLRIDYSGGSVDVIAQRYDDAGYTSPDYGVEPPNATSPATFADGDVYLHGNFNSFYMIYHPTLHTGNFEGYIDWTLGMALGELEVSNGYAFAGTVDPYGAQVPNGYDLEAVGHVDFNPTVPATESTWGEIRNLYR